jgi:hypothetical protein
MASTADTAATIARPRYRERQVLTASDLAAQQDYLVALRRRHLGAAHSWGVVEGLALTSGGPAVAVQPGVAVDGFGRELVLRAPAVVDAEALASVGTPAADVWLLYGRLAEQPPTPGRRRCGPGRHSRWVEEPCLRLTPAADALDPRDPPGVSDTDLEFDPSRTPPDGSSPPWPVYLGRVERRDAADGAVTFISDLSRRPYAGAVGELLRHPARADALRADGSTFEPIRVDGAGDTRLDADTDVADDVTLAEAAAAARTTSFASASPEPEDAAPWTVYRTIAAADGRRVNQLRIEIEDPADQGDRARYALSIGHRDDEGRFVRCLTVGPDCVVTIDGRLAIDGVLKQGPVGVDPDDPRFLGAVLSRWLRGIAIAGSELGALYSGALAVQALQLAPNPGNRTVGLTATVRNTGAAEIAAIRAIAGATVDGLMAIEGQSLGPAFALSPGAAQAVSGTLDLSGTAGDAVVVTVAVAGAGPSGYPVTASAQGSTSLQVIIN